MRATTQRLAVLAALLLPSPPFALAQSLPLLSDTEPTRFGAYAAWLVEPTLEYDHGALGDPVEAKGFVISGNGRKVHYRLPSHKVFEDRKARLADIDGDGRPEALIVRTDRASGASLALFTLTDDGIELMAESAYLGKPHRWLNPVGIADFAGTGEQIIAAVVTPHLSGSLRFYRVKGRRLVEIGGLDGVTNHILGKRDLDLARIFDVDGDGAPDIVLPTLDRKRLLAISFAGGEARIVKEWFMPNRIAAIDPLTAGRTIIHLDDRRTMPFDLSK